MAAKMPLEVLFEHALAYPAELRDAYVNKACGRDETLRKELASLLAAYEEALAYFARLTVGVRVLVAFPPPPLTRSAHRYLLQHAEESQKPITNGQQLS